MLAVPPQNTSRTCLGCDHVSADNRKTQARFKCVKCGFEDNADLVAAKNILWLQAMPLQPVERMCSQTSLLNRNPLRGYSMLLSLVGIPVSSGRGGCQ